MTSYLISAMSYLISAMSYLISVMSYLISVMSNLISVMIYFISVMRRRPDLSLAFPPPTTLAPHPLALHAPLQALPDLFAA